MAFKFRGGDRTSEDVTKRAKMSGGSYDSYLSSDAPFFKAREGENVVRILPPTWDDKEKWGSGWEIVAWIHRNVGPDNATYLCLDKMKGKRCPVCEARRDAADEEEADSLRVSPRPLCWIIDRDNEKAGPQVFSMPVSLFRDINGRSVDKKSGDLLLIDGDKEGYGYDVTFTREGTDKKTKYTAVDIDREETLISDDEKKQDRWLNYIEDHPLPDMLQFYDADHIEQVLYGKSERRGKTDDDEEPDRRARRRPSKEKESEEEEEQETRGRRRGRSEPEEEDTSTRRRGRGREEPEEDAEEQSTRGKRRGREEPEQEEETTERPSRSRGRASEDNEEETTTGRGGGVARRRGRSEDDSESNEEETGEDESPTRQARAKLEGMRSRRR